MGWSKLIHIYLSMEKDLKKGMVMTWVRGLIQGFVPPCPSRDQCSKSLKGGQWRVVCLDSFEVKRSGKPG